MSTKLLLLLLFVLGVAVAAVLLGLGWLVHRYPRLTAPVSVALAAAGVIVGCLGVIAAL
ncbi:hypothetical protein AB0P12_27780 [Streptomyces subrutilus]|uniref:Uncharacterized protein n=1 Tax=Streptomyces subrutilus TaxID=36818 RepID=A0A918REN6_9ACTN|nr:hypothetical protein [Streptomyces subrutilus]GGZ97102.1 hypothetical protein GCM10010371_66200 [Streptomyces subrutilus]